MIKNPYNHFEFRGEITKNPVHVGHNYYETEIVIPRRSTRVDTIPLRFNDTKQTPVAGIKLGAYVNVQGQISAKTSVRRTDKKSYSVPKFTGFAKSFNFNRDIPLKDWHDNRIELDGYVVAPIVLRNVPNIYPQYPDKIATNFTLAVDETDVETDYISIEAWDEFAKQAEKFAAGARMRLVGRAHTHKYKKFDATTVRVAIQGIQR